VSKRGNAKANKKPVSLLVLEGDTEQIFYPLIRNKFLQGIRIELRNMKGRGNVNKDILGEIYKYLYTNSNESVRAYCCVDSERDQCSATPLDLELIRQKAKERKMSRLLGVDQILADPDIESWFFYDIDGIRRFIRAKKSQLNTRRYANPKNLRKKDLRQLFDRFGKVYVPGQRATNFINNLDIKKIALNCGELREGIQLIQFQAADLTNHLFPAKKPIDN